MKIGIEALTPRAENNKANVRREFAGMLAKTSAPALPLLTKLLSDADAKVRRAAATAVAEQVAAAEDAESTISSDLVEGLHARGETLTRALAKVETSKRRRAAAQPAIAALAGLLRDPDADVRWATGVALSKIGAPAVGEITPLLKDKEAEVRWEAVSVLGSLGAVASSAIPELKKLLEDPNTKVASAADEAIQKIEQAVRRANTQAGPRSLQF